jgi:copper homeostasis protein
MAGLLEVCVQGIEDALAAEAGGADRIELCADLSVGGITPSYGTVATACRRLRIPVQVLVRPRGGDFCPTDAEYAVMRADIAALKETGASGLVLGLLQPDGTLDGERTARLVEAAHPLPVTFHKAFDECVDPSGAIAELINLGIVRILTSGGAPTAREGQTRLAELVRAAADRLTILAGGRIAGSDIPALRSVGLTEIHVGSAVVAAGRVDPARVRALVEAVKGPRMSAGGQGSP